MIDVFIGHIDISDRHVSQTVLAQIHSLYEVFEMDFWV